ncbi:hypothetical protein G7Y89_g13351 [Cudoniella acicularis]|uniref:Uncharacterized protein n=1 Tax=Cudoniella acicularis TaxID=354080 RepID=A0A8H4R8G3_9HELO|nr:hypothetical protein G7Y89_g13351 [Cudoniella acicularis]
MVRSFFGGEQLLNPWMYYDSDAANEEGGRASAKVFDVWKRENLGGLQRERTPWFELADRELNEINDFLQSGQMGKFNNGLVLLQNRVRKAQHANTKLIDDRGKISICDYLKNDKKRQAALKKPNNLCDNVSASKTIMGTSATEQSTRLPAVQKERLTSTTSAALRSRFSGAVSTQGQEFGLAHDPGDYKRATNVQGNMSAPSKTTNVPTPPGKAIKQHVGYQLSTAEKPKPTPPTSLFHPSPQSIYKTQPLSKLLHPEYDRIPDVQVCDFTYKFSAPSPPPPPSSPLPTPSIPEI